MKTKIVALFGHQGSGKSEIANMLKLQWGPVVDILPFSEPIKEIGRIVFGVGDSEKNTQFVSFGGARILKRELYQRLGECMKNAFTKNIWMNLWSEKFRENRLTVVPDLRFDNERKMLKYKNALIIKVEKPNTVGICLTHESEKEWPSFTPDITILNKGTKNELYAEVRSKIFPHIDDSVFIDYAGYKRVKEEEIIKEPSSYYLYIPDNE